MSEQAKEGYLTLVGHGLYNQNVFENEAKKFGIQRALQLNVLAKMHWGTTLLFGIHDKSGEGRKGGNVKIFGKSHVRGISYTLPPEIKEKIVSKLHVTQVVDAAGAESRQCGSYVNVGGVEVTDSIEGIVNIIIEACKEANIKTGDYKFFARGGFQKLNPEQIIESSLFRGFKRVPLPDGPREIDEVIGGQAIGIESYERRLYLKKKEKEELKSETLGA